MTVETKKPKAPKQFVLGKDLMNFSINYYWAKMKGDTETMERLKKSPYGFVMDETEWKRHLAEIQKAVRERKGAGK